MATTHMDTRTAGPARGAQRVIETVQAHGVPYIFGVPGAKVDQVYDVLVDGGPELVVCRHEQNAAFMAAAVGRLTGRPGTVLVTSGPGTSNLVTGLLTANTEGDPVVALCGAAPREQRLKRTHQSMDAAALLGVVTKSAGEVNDPDNVPEAVANAFRIAATEPRGAAGVILPADVMAAPTLASITEPLPVPRLGPAPAEEIARAAGLIRAARRPVLLVGVRGADVEACAAVRALLAETGLPVVETFQAASVVSRALEDHYLGRVGLFRNQPGDVAIAHADVVVTIGYDPVEYDPGLWNPAPGTEESEAAGAGASHTIVHIDSVPAQIDNHYRPALELRGDVAATVFALVRPLAGPAPDAEAAAEAGRLRRTLAEIDETARAAPHGRQGLNPVRVILTLREHLADDATIACDGGSHYIYVARHLRVYEPRHLLFSNGQQTLGVALPWAIAASLLRPRTHVVSISGDGGFLFSSMELETAVRVGATFTHVIMRDNSYNMVAFQQMLKYGRTSGVDLGDYDIVRYAASFGAHGHRADSEPSLAAALRRSLAEPGPSIIDVPVDSSHNTDLFAQLPGDLFE
ncbi:acetolactate synthase AlsS [Planotetraspora kaengkrachanensis]|uniref:Acetolactate synthase n=1 Tax=Planotetraspora kaengkrachanensis TaxID=575193 RepID=A0A8J3PPC4_9ACTN|nr:acetolactate synthase AlsS [Planotetraspora kaengkrachanensis]GIG76892.1 acetolactate synthase [Planotetraspora kaengkrachanensis]